MRYLVLTDIHANLEALDVCLRDAGSRRCDQILILGDLVGYGPDPNEIVSRVRALNVAAIVRGNHDKAACGIDQAEGFNQVARAAALWTFQALAPEHREWLAALPEGPHSVDAFVEICHGAPFDEDAYIFDEADALRALKAATRPLCVFGHTHCPVTFELSDGTLEASGPAADAETRLALREGVRYLINPGAVGQPRDGDPRAAYAIVDVDGRAVELFRLDYPVQITQRKIRNAGLPEVLAGRLGVGR